MRFRTKLFIIWGAVVLVLWAGTGLSVRSAIQSSFDRVAAQGFAGTRRDLQSLQAERQREMRQAAGMVMNIPELRALIAEHNFEIAAENLENLQDRLDNLAGIVSVSFICVLDSRGGVIAQNHASPWKSVPELGTYLASNPQGAAMVNKIFRGAGTSSRSGAADAFGMWSFQDRLYQVVGVPLVFNSDATAPAAADGGLVMAIPVTDDLAAELAQSHNCHVSFLCGTKLIACSLPASLRPQLQNASSAGLWPADGVFDVTLAGISYRSSLEKLSDSCSGQQVGAMLVQSDLKDSLTARDRVSKRLVASMAGGLLAAAIASFLVSGAITRPVRELSRGVHRLAQCDLDVSILVRSKDELGELATAFNDMVRQIRVRRELERLVEESRAMSEAKSRFLANMSHEIRTPLNGVIGMADLLLRTTLTDRQQKYAGIVKSSAEVLTTLINDILDFSKIEAGKLELESVDFNLHELTEDVVELLAIKAMDKGLQVACDIDPGASAWVRGDPTRIRQIIVNLLNNAVKFTERGEVVVALSREGLPGNRGQIRVEVSDTGIGIPPERIDRLFQSFSQVDASTTRRFGGTGLGLAICKQLVELMGGVIGVRSDPGRGSTFWFTAPLETGPARGANENVLSVEALVATRVLIIEANERCRQILCGKMAYLGCRAEAVASEPEAIQSFDLAESRGIPFQIVIVDSQSVSDKPRGQGFETANDPAKGKPSVPILMLIPLGKEPDLNAVQCQGAVSYITKPIRMRQLHQAMLAAKKRIPRAQSLPAGMSGRNLPIDPAPAAAAPSGKYRARILVAEDNEINQMVASELLTSAGYACDVVCDGEAAIAVFDRGGYDLILMDCQMPRMDGMAATGAIRAMEQAASASGARPRRIPILALTANAGVGEQERCLTAGMDAYVAKPFNVDRLLKTIASHLPEISRTGSAAAGETAPPVARPSAAVPDKNPAALPQSAAFDVQGMLRRCSGSASTVLAVLEKFEMQSAGLIADMNGWMAENAFEEIARAAHRLKGTAGIMSAEGLLTAAAKLEELSKAQDTSEVADGLATVCKEVENCIGYASAARAALNLPIKQ